MRTFLDDALSEFRSYVTKLIVVYIVINCLWILYLSYSVHHKELSDLRYRIVTEEKIAKANVLKIPQEKGREPQYKIQIGEDEPTQISEQTYMEYIDGGNNTVAVQVSTMEVYIGHTQVFGIPTDFTEDVEFIAESRVSYPWEDKVMSYTEKDAEALATAYLKGEVSVNGVCSYPEQQGLLKFVDS